MKELNFKIGQIIDGSIPSKLQKLVYQSYKQIVSFVVAFSFIYMEAFASLNFGEKIGKWLLDQLFWVFLGATLVAMGIAAYRRAWLALIPIFLVGLFLVFLASSPEFWRSMGKQVGELVQ